MRLRILRSIINYIFTNQNCEGEMTQSLAYASYLRSNDMANIAIDYKMMAIELFKNAHKNEQVVIVQDHQGVFGVIKDYNVETEPMASAVPVYVNYPVSQEYLDKVYQRYYTIRKNSNFKDDVL